MLAWRKGNGILDATHCCYIPNINLLEAIENLKRRKKDIIRYDLLTKKQLRELKKNMSRSELKEFEKKQRRAQTDREWDAMMMAEIFMDD